MDMPVRNNLSYATTPPPQSTTKTCGAVPHEAGSTDGIIAASTIVNQDVADHDGPEYSYLGPQYETISSSRETQDKNQAAHARLLSERYEYSEAHCVQVATDNGGAAGESVGYENLEQNQCTENEEYSHLKY